MGEYVPPKFCSVCEAPESLCECPAPRDAVEPATDKYVAVVATPQVTGKLATQVREIIEYFTASGMPRLEIQVLNQQEADAAKLRERDQVIERFKELHQRAVENEVEEALRADLAERKLNRAVEGLVWYGNRGNYFFGTPKGAFGKDDKGKRARQTLKEIGEME